MGITFKRCEELWARRRGKDWKAVQRDCRITMDGDDFVITYHGWYDKKDGVAKGTPLLRINRDDIDADLPGSQSRTDSRAQRDGLDHPGRLRHRHRGGLAGLPSVDAQAGREHRRQLARQHPVVTHAPTGATQMEESWTRCPLGPGSSSWGAESSDARSPIT